MVLFNYSTKEITAKVVYYGPGLCGKTTNLQFIYDNLPGNIQRGRMLSLATKTDRTLFFDFLPIDLGTIRGMRTRVQLYTVPGQVFYNSTRKLVLKGADGLVFVADSQEKMKDANLESFRNLEENCIENGINLAETPLVLQFNKRDLPGVASLEELNTLLNKYNAPFYESVATTGIGVHESLKAITKLVLHSLREKYAGGEKESRRSSIASPMASPAPPVPPAAETPLVLEEESVAAAVPPEAIPLAPESPAASGPIALSGSPELSPADPLQIEEPPFAVGPEPGFPEGGLDGMRDDGVELDSGVTGGDLESAFAAAEVEEEVEELDLEEDALLIEEPEQPAALSLDPAPLPHDVGEEPVPVAAFPDPAPEEPIVEGLLSVVDAEEPAPGEESFADLAEDRTPPVASVPVSRASVEPVRFEDDPLGLGDDAVGPREATCAITVRPGTDELEIPLEIDAGGTVERYRLRLRLSLTRED